ncbi:unnamed protein product [Chondrus crispus]|uniref:Uncharacterized protein n=1 Tax=Chondrus crispus TaxID=2769 RepID=R7QI01_CHOCR|nr:unnamed protein product [Chondrus crispus]CDF37709.1 unnamed protein product [Chondrus crispus]|eukprot:XP_005717580.1 unnamed protein product [Chondrus crispus]
MVSCHAQTLALCLLSELGERLFHVLVELGLLGDNGSNATCILSFTIHFFDILLLFRAFASLPIHLLVGNITRIKSNAPPRSRRSWRFRPRRRTVVFVIRNDDGDNRLGLAPPRIFPTHRLQRRFRFRPTRACPRCHLSLLNKNYVLHILDSFTTSSVLVDLFHRLCCRRRLADELVCRCVALLIHGMGKGRFSLPPPRDGLPVHIRRLALTHIAPPRSFRLRHLHDLAPLFFVANLDQFRRLDRLRHLPLRRFLPNRAEVVPKKVHQVRDLGFREAPIHLVLRPERERGDALAARHREHHALFPPRRASVGRP